MNIEKTVKQIAKNPNQFEILLEQINEIRGDYNFNKPIKTVGQVIYFCEECEIGEELLQC